MLAIQTAGGIKQLARALGMSHPALREWARVPDHRVLQVEQITGISRQRLRPDLYDQQEMRIDHELRSINASMRFLVNAIVRLDAIADKHPKHPKISGLAVTLDRLALAIQRFSAKIKHSSGPDNAPPL